MQTTKKIFKISLCVIMSVLIGFLYMVQVYGSTLNQTTGTEANSENNDALILFEDKTKRDETTKHFKLDDGSYMAVMYDYPVHFEDADGKWEDYDNSLQTVDIEDEDAEIISTPDNAATTDNTEYKTKSSDFETRISKKSKENNMFKLKADEYKISWGYEGVQKKTAQIVENNQLLIGNERFTVLEDTSQEVLYSDIYNHVDLQVFATTKGIKENLLLKNSWAQKEFVVNYKINGLNAAQKDTKTIELKNADGEVVYTIAAPYMTDANGETSDGVTLAIESQKNKKLSVKISVDEAWVNAWGRAFPVAVDPDVTIMQSNTNTGIVTASTMQPNPDEIPFLTPNSAIFKFPNSVFDLLVRIQQLPGLKTGDVLTGAKLNFNRYTETASGLTINVHESSDEWSQDTICWNTAHPANGTPLYDTTTGVIDYAVDDKDEESLLTWDVTKLAKKWYNQDPDDSYSMVLSKNETSDGMILVHTGYYGNAAISPTFVVTYRSFQGTESNLTYHTHASAYNGEGSVSDYTGNLVLTQNLFEGTGEKMPVDIKMTYNGFDYDTVFQYGTKAEKGWQYSFNKFVAEAPLAMQQEGYRYMYNDEDGTEHYFKLRENATNIWEDEDGLGYVIIPATSSTPVTLDGKSYSDGFYMETPMGITYKFSTPAPVASWGGSTLPNSGIGRIITETDGTGNQITYTYNSEKLSTITDGAGRVYTISYAAASVAGHSYISKIVAPDGKEIEFSRFSSTSGTGFDDRLNRINYPGGIYIGFYYHDDGRLSVAYQAGNSGVEYLYTNGKVTKICEFDSHGNNAGNYIDILYGSDNTTTYTDRYGRSETYTFNNKGETISVLNPNGYISNAEQSNALLITSGAESYTKNYISNSSTPTTSLYNTSHGTIGSTQSTGGTRTIDTSTELVDYEKKQYLGSSSVKINSPNSAAYYTYSMRQINDISALKGKAATFSAYVKTSNVVDAGRTTGISGVYLKIAARDANGTEIALYNSSYTLFGSENWQRMSVTYPEVPENAVQLRIYLQMRDAYGTAWFDCMQLEEGDCANDYNALESGNNFSSSVWQGNSGSATINGASGQEKQVYQTVDVNKSNVAFVLSGSAEMDSVPLTDDTRKAGIKLNIVYEDDEDDDTEDEEEHYQTFNECTGVDQSVALTAYPKYPSRVVDYVEYAFVYDNNANTMVLNDASLCFGDYATDEEFLSRFDSEPETSEPQATTEPTTLAPVEPYQGNFEETENGIKSSYYGTVLTDSSGTEYVESIDLSQPYIKTQTEYDATGNYVIAESDERGNTTEYDIDADNGQTNSIELPDGSVENYTYDDAGRLTEVAANVSGIGNIENEYTYGGNNQLSEINHNGTRYSFSYNSFRNQTGASVGSQIISNNTYEANNGNLTSTSYGNGQSFSYVYDDLDRIVQINTTNNGTSQIFAKYFYNKKGLPSKVIDYSAGRTEIHFYDVWNELRQSVSYSNTGIDYVYSKHYEELGDVVEKATISGITRTITPQIHENLPRLYLFDGGWSSTIDKDELDRIDTIATRFGGSPTIDVFTTEYEYAPASSAYGANAETNLVSSLVQKKANTVLADYDYEYDINGNLTKVFEDGVETIRYEYYKNNILKAQNDMRTHKRVLYQYDVGGNIIYTDEYTIGNNWVADTSTQVRTNYAYDTTWKDKLISYGGQTITYDAIGNPLTYRNGMTFTWENGRQLATLQKGTNTVQYTYDINGIRTQKVSTEGTTKYYYNDSNQLIMANVPSQYGENIMRFYYDENGTPAHVKLARTKANGTTENLRYGYVTNLQGDVVGISDCSGVLRANYEYDAWGKLLSVKDADGNTVTDKSNIALLNPLRYRGYVYDTDSGLYYLQSRYYDPVTGRFINADALEMMLLSDNILGTNLFAYCNDNPVMYSDPMGQQPRWAWAVNRFAKHTTLYKSFLYATIHGWFSSLFWIAGFFRDSKGIYHARQDCWQQFFGYNAFYDWAFDIGTSMLTKNFKFNYGNKEYIFWAWKGDYLNLGAGAELGIYSRLVIRGKSTGHWLAETKLAMPMTLTLKYKGRTIASYKPKQKQWWITSFSPYFQNVKASALQVVFTINFSSQKGLFNAFYSKTKNKPGWKFNTKKYTATFTF